MKKLIVIAATLLAPFCTLANVDTAREVEKLEAASSMGSWFMFCERAGVVEGDNAFLLQAGLIAEELVSKGVLSQQAVRDVVKTSSVAQMKLTTLRVKKLINDGFSRAEALEVECGVLNNI